MDFKAEIETKSLERALRMISQEALPEATAHTLNFIARRVQDDSRKRIQSNFTVRTPYTTNSVRQTRIARGTNVNNMYSQVSSLSGYLNVHDQGGELKAKRSRLNIPTLVTRGGSQKNRIRKRYYANTEGTNRFIGEPNGRPLGLYERTGKGGLKMLRNLTKNTVRLKKTDFFTGAVEAEATQEKIRQEFNRNARRILNRIQRRA
jgi:hypothetical protein